VAGALTAYPLLRYFQVTATVRVAVSKSNASLLERLAENLPLCASWLWGYWTPVLIALALFALARAALLRWRATWFVAVSIVVPILAFAGVGDIWFPRYLVFLTAPFVALAAWGADQLATLVQRRSPDRARAMTTAGLVVALLPAARIDWDLLVDPSRASLVGSWRRLWAVAAFRCQQLRRSPPRSPITFCIAHFNSPAFLDVSLHSIRRFHPEARVHVADASSAWPEFLAARAACGRHGAVLHPLAGRHRHTGLLNYMFSRIQSPFGVFLYIFPVK